MRLRLPRLRWPQVTIRRSTRYGANTALVLLLVLGVVVVVEAISVRQSKQFDLTANKRYTLSLQTRRLLGGLQQPIKVTAFYQEGGPGRQPLNDLLKEYAHQGAKLSFEFVDPDRNPKKAQEYKVTAYGTTVVESGDKREKVTGTSAEELTNAVIKATRKGKKAIYCVKGHGEGDPASTAKEGLGQLKAALQDANFEVKELVLLREAKLPDDAAAVILAGPKKELLPPEVKVLDDYLRQRKGRLLAMIDPDQVPGLVKFLAGSYVVVGDDVIIDRLSRVFAGDYFTPVVSQYEDHKISKDLRAASFFPLARSVDVKPPADKKVQAKVLARTGAESWAETNKRLLAQGKAQYDEGQDKKGPVPVAAVVEIKDVAPPETPPGLPPNPEEVKKAERPGTRLVVFGDSDFVTNTYLGLSGNRDLILNTVSWLAEEEDLIAVRARRPETRPIVLTANQGKIAFWVPVVGVPLLVVGVGAGVVARRRLRK
ncbi:MAG: GldG family protein [Deltaproteobacteria bacterium]|nr:GldG family protein [Deltaproteobacteria bacterium]